MTAKENIIELLNKRKELSVKEIADELMVSNQTIHSVLKKLLEEKKVQKFGSSPKTIYKLLNSSQEVKFQYSISNENQIILEQKFLLITEIGEYLTGVDAFVKWCVKRSLPIDKTLAEYLNTLNKYQNYEDDLQMINGYDKLVNTKGYDTIWLDDLFYFDFYAIERFGKTKLGTLLHFAKQGQNKPLMSKLVEEVKPKLDVFILKYNFDAIAYVPPTIRRENQIMKFIENRLNINLPKVEVNKVSNLIPVPQKSLNKLEERINNAENTFAVKSKHQYTKLLLIDDAVGSGSTLNQIAGKIKQKEIAKNIVGLAIVGSYKGFDVITDV